MKKSKVLVPAMALLLFSTAASITGTVAWFSSTRVFETSVGDFAVKEIDGNLTCTVGADVGTEKVGSTNAVKVKDNLYMIDASLDASKTASNIDVYRLSRDATPSAYFTRYTKGEDQGKWLYRTINTDKYYLAVSWTLTFSYEFNTETAPVDILLDLKQSDFTGAAALGEGETQNTALGFRIAFMTSAGTKVWGNRALGAEDHEYDDLKYVTGVANNATASYTASNYFVHDGDYDASSIADGASHASAANCIGTITNTAGTGTLTVTCVAWYEGTDPAVVSDIDSTHKTKLQTLGATLSFFGRSAA